MAASPEVKAMFRELQARPENKVCVDCSSRIPQWASCTYGTYMCLECSGIHRSLGVHISFVQSVTMDSWKNERFVSKMRAGGNAAFNDFLARQGVPAKVIKGPPGTNDPERVREKYHARACALYKDKMDAVADGRSWDEPPPEPYQNLAPSSGSRGSAPSSGGGGGAFAMGGGGGAFAGGSGSAGRSKMEGMGGGGGQMPGRSAEDEAWNMLNDWGKSAASLASKATETVKATTNDLASNVGTVDLTSNLNSIGSAAYERAERARKAAADLAAAQNLDEVGGKLTQTTSEAASMFGSFLGKAVTVASEGLKDTASVVGGTAGGGWWGQQSQQAAGGGNRTAEELGGTSTDPEGMEVMVGEDEQAYIARRTRLQAEAKARMAAKFGKSEGGLGGIASSSASGGGGDAASAAAQQSTRSQQERVARLSSGSGSKEDKWEDDDGWGDDGWGEKSPAPAPPPAARRSLAPAPAPSRSTIDEQSAAVAAMSGQAQPLSSGGDNGKESQLRGMLSAGLITQAEFEQNLATLQRASSTGSSSGARGGGSRASAARASTVDDGWGDDDWGDEPSPAPAPAPRSSKPSPARATAKKKVADDDDWDNW